VLEVEWIWSRVRIRVILRQQRSASTKQSLPTGCSSGAGGVGCTVNGTCVHVVDTFFLQSNTHHLRPKESRKKWSCGCPTFTTCSKST
jgi:hypothetical protein